MKLASVLAVLAITACSSKQPESKPEPAATPPPPSEPARTAPAAPAAAVPAAPPSGEAASGIPAGFPPECVAYAELIEKLKTCDKLGAARDGLMLGYQGLRSTWSSVPDDQRASFAAQCQTQKDSLHNAAAATCGW